MWAAPNGRIPRARSGVILLSRIALNLQFPVVYPFVLAICWVWLS